MPEKKETKESKSKGAPAVKCKCQLKLKSAAKVVTKGGKLKARPGKPFSLPLADIRDLYGSTGFEYRFVDETGKELRPWMALLASDPLNKDEAGNPLDHFRVIADAVKE